MQRNLLVSYLKLILKGGTGTGIRKRILSQQVCKISSDKGPEATSPSTEYSIDIVLYNTGDAGPAYRETRGARAPR